MSDSSLKLWEGSRPVFVYNHGPIRHPTATNAPSHSAYLHPVYGLDGEVLTDDFPKDHDYHRGLYWAWPHVTIGGREYDLWSLRGIRSEFRRWLKKEATFDFAILAVENTWLADGHSVMKEQVQIEIHRATADSRAVDLELTWTPIEHAITLAGAPGKSYGGLNLRFGARTQTYITEPTGRTAEDLLMKPLPWIDLSGDFTKGGEDLSGAAIFVHPGHSDFPPTWMARHYGLLAVGWPGVTARTFPAGEPFSCRYRIWIHRQALARPEIQKAYDAYRSQGERPQHGAR